MTSKKNFEVIDDLGCSSSIETCDLYISREVVDDEYVCRLLPLEKVAGDFLPR